MWILENTYSVHVERADFDFTATKAKKCVHVHTQIFDFLRRILF